MYILFCKTNKKNVQAKEIKDLTSEVFNLSNHLFLILSNEGPNIYDVHMERGWGGPEICHVFTDSIAFKQHIYCLFLQMKGRSVGVVCKGYNCMIPNIKTYFDKKVTFLDLMPVLQ